MCYLYLGQLHLIPDIESKTVHDNSDKLEINKTSSDLELDEEHISLPIKPTSLSSGKVHIKLPSKYSFMPSSVPRNTKVRRFLLRRYNVLTISPLKLNVSIKDVEWKKKISKTFVWKH